MKGGAISARMTKDELIEALCSKLKIAVAMLEAEDAFNNRYTIIEFRNTLALAAAIQSAPPSLPATQ